MVVSIDLEIDCFLTTSQHYIDPHRGLPYSQTVLVVYIQKKTMCALYSNCVSHLYSKDRVWPIVKLC